MKTKLITTLFLLAAAAMLSAGQLVSTTYPVWLLSRMITAGSGNIQPALLIDPAAGCAHDFTILPGTLRQVARRNTVLIAHGAGVDDHITRQAHKVNPQLKIITAAVPAADVHTFVSPDTASGMAQKIADGLIKNFPQESSLFKKNLQLLQKNLAELSAAYSALPPGSAILQSTIFVNLAKIANTQAVKLKENHTGMVSAHKMQQIIRRIRREKIAVLWCEKNSRDPAVETILKNCSIRRVELDIMISGSTEVPTDHLLQLMRNNYETLRKAMQK